MNFGTNFRDPTTGLGVASIPFGEWLYFEYHQIVNDFGRVQGIVSPFKSPKTIGVFEQRNGDALDRILEVWFKPFAMTGLDNSGLDFFLDNQYLVRYERLEHLNDGRPRDTFIGRSKEHLLARTSIIPPQEDPLVAPYAPVAPWRVPPHHFSSTVTPSPIPLGAGPWPLPVTDGFDGSFPVPPAALVGTSTGHRMAQIVHYAKTYLNINTLADITIATPIPALAGLLDHPIDIRYDNLLEVLQKMSAATWFAWFHGELAAGQLPVDFALTPDPAAANKWIFEIKVGGLGIDRTIDGVLGGTGPVDAVVLSVENDNVIQPVSLYDRTAEITRVYVGGKNTGTARDVIAVVDLDRALQSPWNLNDRFVHSAKIKPFLFDGSADDGIKDAIERGLSRLNEEAPRDENTLITRFNRSLRKGVNLFVGDIVTGALFREPENFQVHRMRHIISRTGGITIRVELIHLDGRHFKGGDEFQQILNRQQQIRSDSQYTGEAD